MHELNKNVPSLLSRIDIRKLGVIVAASAVAVYGSISTHADNDSDFIQSESVVTVTVTEPSVYSPGNTVDTSVVVITPEEQNSAIDIVDINESMTLESKLQAINKGQKAISFTLGPDAPTLPNLRSEDVSHLTVPRKGTDEKGQPCYGSGQSREIARAAKAANLADQYIIIPRPNDSFCTTGETATDAVAWVSDGPNIFFVNDEGIGDVTYTHEWAHLIKLKHFTKAEFIGDKSKESDFLEKRNLIQDIVTHYRPYKNAKGETDMYRSNWSTTGTGPSLEDNKMTYTTVERAIGNEINQGDPNLYRTIHVDPTNPPEGLIPLSLYGSKDQEDFQTVEIDLPADHALRTFDPNMEKIVVALNYKGPALIDEPLQSAQANCQTGSSCSVDLIGVTSSNDFWEIPEIGSDPFMKLSDDSSERAFGSVMYIDEQIGIAVLRATTMRFGEGDIITYKHGIQIVKLKDLDNAQNTLETMGDQLLAAK